MKKTLKNHKGFTLIEIIAVLVILGIMAAVAVPKFTDLQLNTKKKSVEIAFAAGVSEVNQAYASFLLENNGTKPTAVGDNKITGGENTTAVDINDDLGDFTVTYADGAADGDYKITIATGPNWIDDLTDADKTKDFPEPWN